MYVFEINNNKYVYRQSQVRKSTDSGSKWAECSLIIGTGCRVQVLAGSLIAQSVCQRAFSLLAIWCLGPRVQILHSAEEHNLSPFDLNIAWLCQSMGINNNKYVYRQSQVRKSTNSGAKWAAGGVASVWKSWVRSPPGPQQFSLPLWVYMPFPVPEHNN